MPQLANATPERQADHFITYLFEHYHDNRHVRRVASWVGLIVKGIAKLGANPYVPRDRQLKFNYNGKTYKARFNHHAGARGGIEIVEILPGRGSPEGQVARSITDLDEAEAFYNNPSQSL